MVDRVALDSADGGVDSLTTHLGLCLNEAQGFGVALPVTVQFNTTVHGCSRDAREIRH